MIRQTRITLMVAGLVAITILGLAAASAIQPNGTIVSKGSSSQTLLSACNTEFPNGVAFLPTNNSQGELALIMKPGTVAALCVTFASSGGGNLSAGFFSAKVYSVNATPLYNSKHYISGWEYSYNPAPGIKIASNAEMLPLQNLSPRENITVVYTITSDVNFTGYYDLSFPNSCPSKIPLAVVNASQSADASDFPGFLFPSSCALISPQKGPLISVGLVTGVTGINTAWLSPNNLTNATTNIGA